MVEVAVPPTTAVRASVLPGFDVIGTALFVLAEGIAIPLRNERVGQVIIIAVSMLLFAVGVATSLWAYTAALERSRVQEVGVANLFMLTGGTAPKPIRRTMSICLAAQVIAALGGATAGVVGLEHDQLNALAFGVLVPMFGIGVNGLWAARYGTYGPRLAASAKPTNRKME
jgi:hypothetical protein